MESDSIREPNERRAETKDTSKNDTTEEKGGEEDNTNKPARSIGQAIVGGLCNDSRDT